MFSVKEVKLACKISTVKLEGYLPTVGNGQFILAGAIMTNSFSNTLAFTAGIWKQPSKMRLVRHSWRLSLSHI